MQDMRKHDEEEFFFFTRMSVASSDALLDLIKSHLKKNSIRQSISPDMRLYITLRFLASGDSYGSLHLFFRIGKSTVQQIVKETCEVLWDILSPLVLIEPTEEGWQRIASEFEFKFNLPFCCGSLDGIHLRIEAPAKSGSQFYNYKGPFSMNLLTLCDANYNFICLDIGAYGSQRDGGLLENSILGEKLKNSEFQFPKAEYLSGTSQLFNYFVVTDSAFPLTHNILKPYSTPRIGVLPDHVRYFNYRLSRARISIENTFGILAARWRIFHITIFAEPETVDRILKAVVVLHNFIKFRKGDNIRYAPADYVDREEDGKTVRGKWRNESLNNIVIHDIPSSMRIGSRNYKLSAHENRNTLLSYISSVGR